jgi:hypothetical protein
MATAVSPLPMALVEGRSTQAKPPTEPCNPALTHSVATEGTTQKRMPDLRPKACHRWYSVDQKPTARGQPAKHRWYSVDKRIVGIPSFIGHRWYSVDVVYRWYSVDKAPPSRANRTNKHRWYSVDLANRGAHRLPMDIVGIPSIWPTEPTRNGNAYRWYSVDPQCPHANAQPTGSLVFRRFWLSPNFSFGSLFHSPEGNYTRSFLFSFLWPLCGSHKNHTETNNAHTRSKAPQSQAIQRSQPRQPTHTTTFAHVIRKVFYRIFYQKLGNLRTQNPSP